MGGAIMYYYFFDRAKREVTEMTDLSDKDKVIFKTFGIKYYDHFPYEEAGFEDPYAFLEHYKLVKLVNNVFEVEEDV